MSVEIQDGWIEGTLPGPDGEIPVEQYPRDDQRPWSRLVMDPPNLCLHTTEGGTSLGDAYKRWEYPPNFACGDGKIVQLFPLGYASEAVDTKDGWLLQIEMAYSVGAHPPAQIYLPPAPTLNPTVALVAFLHRRGFITNGLKRPNPDWPLALDKLPAATDRYYRRNDGTWPKFGVYGHVEIPDDEHYDPASFDYPRFFALVQGVLEGDDVSLEEYIDGEEAYRSAFANKGQDPGQAPENKPVHFRKGWTSARFAARNPDPIPGPAGPHTHTVALDGVTGSS